MNMALLRLTEKSREILKGQRAVFLHQREKSKRLSEEQSNDDLSNLNTSERVLWNQLRIWRATTAKEHGVPAYVIFHDSTLLELVRLCPRNANELSQVAGIGARRLEKYGNHLIAIFLAYSQADD